MVVECTELEKAWDRVYRQHGVVWGVQPTSSLVLILNKWKTPAGRALDFGCGTGRNSVYAANKGWEVTAVDCSQEAIRVAKRLTSSTLLARIEYTTSTEPISDEKYDLVICCGVLHAYNDKKAARLCTVLRETLRPKGLLLASFFCGCIEPQRLNGFRIIECGNQSFKVWPHCKEDFADWLYPSPVQVLKHGLSTDQHGFETEHVHHVVHCVARMES